MTLTDALADVDAIFDRFAAGGAAPGLAFGVVVDGELVHAGGRGTLRVGESAEPGPDSVFRIASMTKSFTAATVILLRDEGQLRLDDPVARWVPELARLKPWSRDSSPLTVESLLTMSAGFPTDDPWGDRLQDQDQADFLSFLEAGPELAWPIGTHFEYTNLGYAILGLIVARVAGDEYRTVVERRLLEPLGLAATSFSHDGIERERLAHGYVRRGETWIEEPMAAYGAFAPMGGLFTSVRDLARWIGGFSDAFPARDDPEGDHPLSRASRREMQQIHRAIPPELTWTSASSVPSAALGGYGYGLQSSLDVRLGRVVSHSGGYPGFGSHMRWHPASGVGVVGVANGRYARIDAPAREALELLVGRAVAPLHRSRPWPATENARLAVERLIETWDDDLVAKLFAANVALDEDLASRRAAIERVRAVHGPLRADDMADPESSSATHLAWWLRGKRGRVRVEILMSPDRPARVQALTLVSVPEPPERLAALARRIVAALAVPSPSWPGDVALAEDIDRSALDRDLRAAEAVFGPLALGPATDGDGETKACWRLTGPRGDVTLAIASNTLDGPIASVSLVPVTLVSPAHLA